MFVCQLTGLCFAGFLEPLLVSIAPWPFIIFRRANLRALLHCDSRLRLPPFCGRKISFSARPLMRFIPRLMGRMAECRGSNSLNGSPLARSSGTSCLVRCNYQLSLPRPASLTYSTGFLVQCLAYFTFVCWAAPSASCGSPSRILVSR